MSSRRSAAPAEFADGRWPDGRDDRRMPRAVSFRGEDPEPPIHPSEFDPFENPRWRQLLATFGHFAPGTLIAFCVGIAATLAWQAYGNGARRMVANSFPQLGWLAPLATAAPSTPGPNAPGSETGASPEQLAAISHSLAVVRQSVDRLAADVARLQARQEPPVRTGVPTPAPAAATGRKPASQAR
jgi:hypothetical protein